MTWLAVPATFEYPCYGSIGIINMLILSVRGLYLDVKSLKSKDVRLCRLNTFPTPKGLKFCLDAATHNFKCVKIAHICLI